MVEKCKICDERTGEWGTDSLREHVQRKDHNPASVRAMYPDIYDEVWGDDAPTSATDDESRTLSILVDQPENDEPARATVLDNDGEPIEGATVEVEARTGSYTGHGAFTTGSDGTVSLPVPDNDVTVEILASDNGGSGRATVDLNSEDIAYGKKWYMIGVGGAGNNIIDAILLRQETLVRNNEDRAHVWQGGLAGYGILNTNIAELEQTYYAQEVKKYGREDLLANAIIGFGKSDYAGAGYRWDIGKQLMAADLEDGGDPLRERWDMKAQDIRDAQAVMLIHSVTKGTGSGATPVLAEYIREKVFQSDFVVPKPLLSSVVLPSEGSEYSEFGGRAKANGVVGLARISQAVDALIPFDNHRLANVGADITPRIENIEKYNPPQYAQLNKPLVAFLEAFTMSSIPQFLDRDASMSIKGDVFDVADSFRPAEDKYPLDIDREYKPAVVLAPVLGRSREGSIDRSGLEILIRNALYQNGLADFDPQTAWGGTFLLYGPHQKMEQVSSLVDNGTFSEIISGEEFLNAGSVNAAGTIDIHVQQVVNPYLDDIYLWGTLWNPEIEPLERMYDHAKRLKEEANDQQAENLREIWHLIDPLFSCLGRDNMA